MKDASSDLESRLGGLPWPRARDAGRLQIPRVPARLAALLRLPFPLRYSTLPRPRRDPDSIRRRR